MIAFFDKFKLQKEKFAFRSKNENEEYFHKLALTDVRKYKEKFFEEHEELIDVAHSREIYFLNSSIFFLIMSGIHGVADFTFVSLLNIGISFVFMLISLFQKRQKIKYEKSYFTWKLLFEDEELLKYVAIGCAEDYYKNKNGTNSSTGRAAGCDSASCEGSSPS